MYELMPPTKVYIDARTFNKVQTLSGAKDWSHALRALIKGVFSEEVLAAHSCLGKRSKFPALPQEEMEVVKCEYCHFSDI